MWRVRQGAGMDRDALLEAARRGDEPAFERLIARHRRELHAHC
jgi:DNA-directed RNA polymerase specialized sigma24 family protein